MREGVQTDHEFEPSPYCDCDVCNSFCHWHYGQPDACLLERHLHQPRSFEVWWREYNAGRSIPLWPSEAAEINAKQAAWAAWHAAKESA